LWLVAALTWVASFVLGGIAVANSSWLDVEVVQVSGAVRADPRQIVTASGIVVGEPLVDVDPEAAVAGAEAVPWVAEATVERDWRGSVTISVNERQGIVALATGHRFAIVDRTGRQLEVVADRPSEFVPVDGVEASGVPGQPVGAEALAVIALAEALTPEVRQSTAQIVIVDGQLTLDLAAGGRVLFGDDRDLADKLVALETMLARVDLSCLHTIDVRVASAPTVSRTVQEASGEEPSAGAGGC
jgi:cell division protein FtsQ